MPGWWPAIQASKCRQHRSQTSTVTPGQGDVKHSKPASARTPAKLDLEQHAGNTPPKKMTIKEKKNAEKIARNITWPPAPWSFPTPRKQAWQGAWHSLCATLAPPSLQPVPEFLL